MTDEASLESRRLENTRPRVGDAVGLLGLALAGLLAVGGAASSTDGFLLGIPPLPWVVVVMALVAAAATLAPSRPFAAVPESCSSTTSRPVTSCVP